MTKPTTYWDEEDHVTTILETYESLDDAAESVADLVTRLEPTDANDVFGALARSPARGPMKSSTITNMSRFLTPF